MSDTSNHDTDADADAGTAPWNSAADSAWRLAQRELRRLLGLDDREVLCKACDHPMRMTESYHPVLFEYVPAWACDECGRTVVRDDPYDTPSVAPDEEF